MYSNKRLLIALAFVIVLCWVAVSITPSQAQRGPLTFTNSSGAGWNPDGTFAVGLEAFGQPGGTAHYERPLGVVPKHMRVWNGTVDYRPRDPEGWHLFPGEALYRMWLVSDTGQYFYWFNEKLSATFEPKTLPIAPFEFDVPPGSGWKFVCNIETARSSYAIDVEIQLIGHWE